MNLRHICAAAGIAAFMVATAANATVHRVFPDKSGSSSVIQAAIDKAKPGDTILVEPGTYKFTPKNAQKWQYGLRIKTHNLRLIGKVVPGQGERARSASFTPVRRGIKRLLARESMRLLPRSPEWLRCRHRWSWR